MEIFYKGIRLNYEIYGEGKTVLFLHGWGGEINSFLPILQELKSKYRCVAVDFLGFGKSDYPNVPFSVSDYKDSVVYLLDYLKLRKIDIIAHSFGGRVAFKLMSENPNYVKSAILIAPAGIRGRRRLLVSIKIAIHKIKKLLHKFGAISSDSLEKDGSEDYKGLIPVMKKTFINVVNEDLSKDIKKIRLPVLLVHGINDTAVPLYMIKKIKRLIPTSDYISLFGGHFCYISDSYRFNKIAISFLSNFN